jgi:hypothetical protein
LVAIDSRERKRQHHACETPAQQSTRDMR